MIKWYLIWLVVLAVGISAILYTSRSLGNRAQGTIAIPTFDQDHAWQDLEYQVNAGYRVPGTPTHRAVRDWLVKDLAKSGPTMTQQFSAKLGGREVVMWNIITTLASADAGTAREPVLLAAHWDSRPTADYDPDPEKRSQPIAGASDGASGVAVLLEIARQLKAQPIDRQVTIVLFDGEDYGPKIDNMLLGSRYYAAHLPEKKPAWGILLDMVGDKDLTIYREPNSDQYAKTVNDRIFRSARELGYVVKPGRIGFIDFPYQFPIDDDHMPINRAGVPMADIIDFNYSPWHTTQDTLDKCSPDSLAMVGKTVLYALQMD